MKKFAVVNPSGGNVGNVVVGEDIEIVQAVVGPCVEVTDETGPAAEGYIWDGVKFTSPFIPTEE